MEENIDILIGVETKQSERFRNCINEVKKYIDKGCNWNSYLALHNPVVLPTVPWKPLKFPTNSSEIIKIYGTTEIRAPIDCLKFFRPNITAEIYFMTKRVSKNTQKEKKNDPTE